MNNKKSIFIGALQNSGASFLENLLVQHPKISSVCHNHGVQYNQIDHNNIASGIDINANEGQLLQTVYLPDEFFGGSGFWGFHSDAHLTESSDLITEENINLLLTQWNKYWDHSKSIQLERSASNILKSRFLNKIFPNNYQIFILRHPIANAYATERILDDTEVDIENLICHWIYVHQIWQSDCHYLKNYRVVYWEELLQNPQNTLDLIFEDLGIDSYSIDYNYHNLSINRQEWESWDLENQKIKKSILKLEDLIQNLNYSLHSKSPLHIAKNEIKFLETTSNPSKINLIPDFINRIPIDTSNLIEQEIPRNLLFVSFGTRGDIQPCIALGLGFQEAGYNVWICSTEEHQNLVESNNLVFVSIGVNHTRLNLKFQSNENFKLDGNNIYEYYQDIEKVLTTLIDCCQDNPIDCLLVNGVLLHDFIFEYLKIPCVTLKFAPYYINLDQDPIDYKFFKSKFMRDYIDCVSILSNYKCHEILEQTYKKLSIPLNPADNVNFLQWKRSFVLNGYTPLFPTNNFPGLEYYTTGFWISPPNDNESLPKELEIYLSAGLAPICLNFGSMDVYSKKAWIEPLLNTIRANGQRCIAIGKYVPDSVKEWAYWVDQVSHPLLFPRCRYVIHHGGSGTTAQCLLAGVPSIIIPVLLWADQDLWGQWIAYEAAGIYLGSSLQDDTTDVLNQKFTEVLREIESPVYRENAKRLGTQLAKENGVANAIQAFKNHFQNSLVMQKLSCQLMKLFENLKCSQKRKLELSLFVLLFDSEIIPKQTFEYRDRMIDALLELESYYPIYKDDWNAQNKLLDIKKHDLPHQTSGLEIWSFYAYLHSQIDNREFAFTNTLFQNLVRNVQLYHAHSSVLDLQKNNYSICSKLDPRGLQVMAEYIQPRSYNDYLQRALQKVLQQGKYPLPDQKSDFIPKINDDSMYFLIDDLIIYKDDHLNYHIEGKYKKTYSFKLQFQPLKQVILNGQDGIINHLQMFSYFYSRLKVTGTLTIDQETHNVDGFGWYDHKFGSTQENSRFKNQKTQWIWIAIQLDDNSEIVYNPALYDFDNAQTNSKLNIIYVSPSQDVTYYEGNLKTIETWTSLQSFIKYGVAWNLYIQDLDIELCLKAELPDQEIISIVNQPSYWKGSIKVEGHYKNTSISGIGFVEQVGFGTKYFDYKNYLRAVSKETLGAIDRCYPLDPTLEDMRRLIADDALDSLIQGISKESFVKNLIQPVRMMTDRGGKAWRSMSLLLCITAVGTNPDLFRDFLAFPELLHTGSLMVDDVEDNSLMRRGADTCHSIYGLSTAINAGTAAYFVPETILKRTPIPQEIMLEIYQLYFLCFRGSHVGQGLDIQGLSHMVPECLASGDFQKLWEAMLAIHRLKSGLPASIAARVGVLLGNGTNEQKEILAEYFLAIGIAFQIMDDVINLRGFYSGLKTKGEDLIEGKITAPVIQGLLSLNPQKRLILWESIREGASVDDLPMIINLLEECEAMNFCIDYAKNLVENAWHKVESIIPVSYAKLQLRIFGWFVVEIRDY